MKSTKLFGVLFLSFIALGADEKNILNIESLLHDIEKKTDLSEKTKIENAGIIQVYTRNDLERMQSRYLKDILKLDPMFGYDENKYGVPDPLTSGDAMPFMSSSIKVYIDNQEITSGMYGSGIVLFGDIDIGFVDHIEIYTQSTLYEHSSEPSMILVKLYSKSTLKDEGTKVEINIGSLGNKRLSGYSAEELGKDWSYFSYLSLNDNKRKKYKSHDTELSRDSKVAHLFTTFKNKNHNIMIDGILNTRDTFMNESLDATPQEGSIKDEALHLGYDSSIDNLSFLISYDYLSVNNEFSDDVTPNLLFLNMYPVKSRDITTKSSTYTAEVKHHLKMNKNTLVTGLKYRYKKYNTTKHELNNIQFIEGRSDSQVLTTIFAENQYSYQKNMIFTAGIEYKNIKNKDAQFNEDDNALSYRLGFTYVNDKWVFKTIGSHSELYLEPYLIDRNYVVSRNIENHEVDVAYQNIILTEENNKYTFLTGIMQNKNVLVPDANNLGKLNTYNDDINIIAILARWEMNYNKYDKLFVELSHQDRTNPWKSEHMKIYHVFLRSLNTYKKFDLFNELLYKRTNEENQNYFDYTFGLKYNYTKDLIVSLKAENIFNKAQEQEYFRQTTTFPYLQEESLFISPIDRSITISMEYLF